jgi:hypothetical protein
MASFRSNERLWLKTRVIDETESTRWNYAVWS